MKQTIEMRVLSIKEEEANKWLSDLLEWIKKNHPHLEHRWWEGSYPEELTPDQVSWLHERADERRKVWHDHAISSQTSSSRYLTTTFKK